MTKQDFYNLNPNTLSCPSFITSFDAEISKKVYGRNPIIKDERRNTNPWKVSFQRMFDLSNDSHLFKKTREANTVPLYESKMINIYNHRYADAGDPTSGMKIRGKSEKLDDSALSDPYRLPDSRYFIDSHEVSNRIVNNRTWLFCFRDTTGVVSNKRTALSSVVPYSAVANSAPVLNIDYESVPKVVAFIGNFSSIIFDFFARQKVGGLHMNFFIVEQLPVIAPDKIQGNHLLFIIPRVLELTYTSWDIKPFADDVWKEANSTLREAIENQCKENQSVTGGHEWSPPAWSEDHGTSPEMIEGCPKPPFKWDENRRDILKAELDSIYAKLYGLTTEELRYILDPQDVYGPDFPGETFRVLKEKEIRLYGEYRTRRLVLEAWGRLNGQKETKVEVPEPQPSTQESLFSNNFEPMLEFGLNTGIYSVQDVSGITGITVDKIKRWFKELAKANYEGLNGDGNTESTKLKISFHGLIELVVIGTLRENSFSLAKILKARTDLRSKTGKMYPFATNNVRDDLKVTGNSIIFQLPDGSIITLDGKGQYLLDVIKEFFKDIEFNTSGVAQKLLPKKGKGKIAIDPKVGDGKPSVKDKGVWAETIASIYTGPESIQLIKEQYDLEEDEILAAIEYCQ